MKDAVIFDFDGVIIDSEPIRYETYKKLFLEEYSIALPDKDDVIIGRTHRENIAYFLKKNNLKGNIGKLMDKRNNLLKSAFLKKENIKPFPGLFTLLKQLQLHKIKLAIASSSNKGYIYNILDCLHLADVFDVIVTGDMVAKGKPDPEVFIQAANKLNKKKENCVVIEDSLQGIAAAKAADMKVIAITSSFSREELSSADKVIDDFIQIKIQDIQNI